MTNIKTGIVTKSTGSNYTVNSNTEIFSCKIKGKFRLKGIRTTNPIAVGDKVDFEIQEEKTGVILKIHERQNYIIRKSINLSKESHILAANVDQAILLVTLAFPETEQEFIDRFLVSSEIYKIPAKIIFNKIDLYTPELMEYVEYLSRIYKNVGYDCFNISAKNSTNVNLIKDLLKDKTSVIAGNSGAGKTTLINCLDNSLNLKTSSLSDYHLKGKHTTTFAEMFELKSGGFIIDTPGIKGFGVVDMNKEDIAHNFPEMFNLLGNCRFYNCKHIHEPGCAVKEAVESGEIADFRYISYVNIMEGDENRYREDNYK